MMNRSVSMRGLAITVAAVAFSLLGLDGWRPMLPISPAHAEAAAAKADNDGKAFSLVRVDVTRKYQFTPPDPKAKLFKPGLEWLKENPGRFEISATRAGYTCKGVLTVDAPPVLEDGKPIAVKVTGESTWDMKLSEPSTTLQLTQTLAALMRSDEKHIQATEAKPLSAGPASLNGEQAVTVTVGEGTSIRSWEKDGLRYRSFSTSLSCRTGNTDTQILEAVFVYRQGTMTAASPSDPTPSAAPPVITAPAVTAEPINSPAASPFPWWWLLIIAAVVLLLYVAWKMRRKNAPAP